MARLPAGAILPQSTFIMQQLLRVLYASDGAAQFSGEVCRYASAAGDVLPGALSGDAAGVEACTQLLGRRAA